MAIAPRSRKFLMQAHLQIAAIVPTGQNIGEPTSQQARTIYCVINTIGCDHTEMSEEIRRMRARVSFCIAATEIDAADPWTAEK